MTTVTKPKHRPEPRLKVHLLALAALLLVPRIAEPAPNYALPPQAVRVNVKDFGARGDGITDDTAAIKKAFEATYNAWEVVYFPQGTYLVSDEIRWKRFTIVWGQGPDRSVIKLQDNCPGYSDRSSPRAVLFCRQNEKDPHKHDNVSHSNHIVHLAVHVGADNPAAIGIDFSSHNGGGMEDVLVRAAPGSGHKGISMEREGQGPALVKSVTVEGFDYGMAVKGGAYSMTYEDITLENQRLAGFQNRSHNIAIRRLNSFNTVPALRAHGGCTILVDSNLHGGDSNCAVRANDKALLFLRNVAQSGYDHILRDGRTTASSTNIKEYTTLPFQTLAGTQKNAPLHIPIKDPPDDFWQEDVSEWACITDFESCAAQPEEDSRRSGKQWAPALQAAVDSGKETICFPSVTHGFECAGSEPVIIRASVRRIVGQFCRLDVPVIFDNTKPVVVDFARFGRGIVVKGSGPVVLKRCMGGPVETRPGAGDLFVDDICGGPWRIDRSSVYARSLNEETKALKIHNNGGSLWILSLKTEFSGPVVRSENGARTEILGGHLYPVQQDPWTAAFQNNNASLSLVYLSRWSFNSTYTDMLNHNGETVETRYEDRNIYHCICRP